MNRKKIAFLKIYQGLKNMNMMNKRISDRFRPLSKTLRIQKSTLKRKY